MVGGAMKRDITLMTTLLDVIENADRLTDDDLGRVLCAVMGREFDRTYIACGDDGSRELQVYDSTDEQVYAEYRRNSPDVSIDAAFALSTETLPGWWLSTCLCFLSGDASFGPDYNGPHGERLHREFPSEIYDGGFHADLRPGDGPHRCCLAILHVLLQALIKIEQERSTPSRFTAPDNEE